MLLWLSFCDTDLPKGGQFLGVAIVEVARWQEERESIRAAIKKAHRLRINPGGQVLSFEVPPEGEELARRHLHRLMDVTEIESIFGPAAPAADIEKFIRRGD